MEKVPCLIDNMASGGLSTETVKERVDKGLVKKYSGGGERGGGPEHFKMWWLENTLPTPSIWHKTE